MEWQRIDELFARIPFAEELSAACQAERASVWLVGGCVRDLLLGRTPVDIDLAAQQPEPLARRFAGLMDARVVPLDPERGVWRVAVAAGACFDFCRFRDHDIIGDLSGRDFTFNAIALRLPEHGEDPGGMVDPYHGMDDLQAGVLRMVSPNAFRDDPARILRGFRFFSELPLAIDRATWDAMRDDADRLPLVAPERLLAEWWKLCAGPRAAAAIAHLDEAGALTVLFPELQRMKGVGQNAYHRYDVWRHTLLTVTLMDRYLHHPDDVFHELLPQFTPLLDDTRRRARLIFLALLHDCGKPATRSDEGGRVHFYRHERAGAEIAGQLCRRMRVSSADTRATTSVIRLHLRPLQLMHARSRGELSGKAMIRFFDDAGDDLLDILALALADKSAGGGPAAEPDVQERLRDLYRALFAFYRERYLPALERPLLTGTDLTQRLQYAPGPRVGQLLQRARNLQIEGMLTTRDEALRWAEKTRH